MRTAKTIGLVAILLTLAAFGGSHSNEVRDLQMDVTGILSRFPAADSTERDLLCAELVGLGSEALNNICARLVPSGEGDSSKAEFALNGLAVYVTRPGAEKERQTFVRALLSALKGSSSDEVRAFLISQLELTGRGEAVKPLARFLRNERLAEPAARALRTIGTPAASRSLLKSLDSAPPAAKMPIIKVLGE